MEYIIDKDKAFIRLDQGTEIFSAILEIANKENWKSAHISGIGALKDLELGYYNLDEKTYERHTFSQNSELLSMDGNLSTLDGKKFLHLHGVFSDGTMKCFGGHMFSAVVAVTCEINIRLFNANVERKMNCDVGLATVNF